jgi:hypothetical protein
MGFGHFLGKAGVKINRLLFLADGKIQDLIHRLGWFHI